MSISVPKESVAKSFGVAGPSISTFTLTLVWTGVFYPASIINVLFSSFTFTSPS